jgi:opacity protein-like surface antigen
MMLRNFTPRGLFALFLAGVSAVSFTAASAGDLYGGLKDRRGSLKDVPPYAVLNWTGYYAGTNSGAVVGRGNVSDPLGSSIYGDDVTSPGYFLGGQVGYNKQMGKWVFGAEAEVDWADARGDNTCLAYSGNYVSADCRVRIDAQGTIAGRVGYAAGLDGRTLVFAKAGGAWTSNRVAVTNNTEFAGTQANLQTATSFTSWGWVIGGGVERVVSPRWSVKAEYNYLDFGDNSIGYPSSIRYTGAAFASVAAGSTRISEREHLFKVGVNYHFNAAGPVWDGASPLDLFSGSVFVNGRLAERYGWNTEFGTRYWASTGKFQWDNQIAGNINESRLTYSNLDGNSGELFARIDTPYFVFVKGIAGLGGIGSGKQNDEDWGFYYGNTPIPYSNTVSDEGNGTLGYAVADVGLDILRGTNYRVGPFIGYSHYTQRTDTTGCVQIANGSYPCLAAGDNRLVGTQTAEWNALRLGAAADYTLGYGFRLTTDAAWLAAASFRGRDNHLLRDTTTYFDQKVDNGQGVQFEAILSYDFSNHFSLGFGGRYWAMWGDGTFTCTGCDTVHVTSSPPNPERIATERYGLLVQGSYKLNLVPRPLLAAPLK